MGYMKFDLIESMIDLLENEVTYENVNVLFTDKAKTIIHEIAEYSRNCDMFKKNLDNSESQWVREEKDIRLLWNHMIERIANAPTRLHSQFSVILVMPYVDDLLEVTP